ncbi:MAG: CBS domain-containing protein [Candidatus Omnitrophica bacterium]|nr:CBS domain-containing protein [Candidatus Omnitrophota bacterium]
MDLITTHTNADFDALGSLVAAKKLYPDSRLLLPGSQEEAVRDFLTLAKEIVVVEGEKECRLDDIKRLILVDTRHKHRIGIASELVDKDVEIHIYDHHPRMKGDIIADQDVYEDVGATVTILADILRKKKIKLTPLEATVMLLGIYEETGSLTYRATTKLDVDIVSFLLSQGASLSAVSSYLNRELGENELSFLTRLINSTEKVSIKGVNVTFIEIDSAEYVGELGVLIHKLMDIENIAALFVFVKTPHKRIDIIGRSKIASIDVNKVLSTFGGGGHPGAAAAKIPDRDISVVKKELIAALKSSIKVTVTAADIMATQPKTIDVNTKVSQAKESLIADKLGGMAVTDKGVLVGIITLVGLNKAIKRGFGHSSVKGYMSRRVVTVRPDTPLYAIHKIMSEKDVGVIPVMDRGRMVGIVNRTDVLRNVHDSLFLKPHRIKKDIVLNLSKKMSAILPGDILRLLKKIGREANLCGYGAFVVGGLVRDLILGVKNLDLDIVVEGDAIELGGRLAKLLGASIVIHRKFGTCSLVTKDRLKIDLATARKEIYEKPAALPTVEFSSLKDDLIRRDFTINAMAVSINKASFGQLIDFFGGRRDLAHGCIKVMHDGSFIDDPTRIFRAVRFESRFGFTIDGHTEELIKNALEQSMFDKVEPQRIRDELILILKEAEPLKALRRMSELDELRFIHPAIKLDSDIIKLCGAADEAWLWYERSRFKKRSVERWLLYIMSLFEGLTYNQVSAICNRFVFRGSDSLRIVSCKRYSERIARALAAGERLKPSRIYRLLEGFAFEVTLFIMARSVLMRSSKKAELVRSRIKDYFQKYNGTRIKIRGDDIKAMGLKPSPDFKVILEKVLYNKLDGKLRTKRDELAYVRKLVKKNVGGSA